MGNPGGGHRELSIVIYRQKNSFETFHVRRPSARFTANVVVSLAAIIRPCMCIKCPLFPLSTTQTGLVLSRRQTHGVDAVSIYLLEAKQPSAIRFWCWRMYRSGALS